MTNRATYVIAISVLVLILVGCAAAPLPRLAGEDMAKAPIAGEEMAVPEAPMEQDAERGVGSQPAQSAATERIVIRNAVLDIVVRDTEEVVDEITRMTEDMGGFIVESSLRNYEEGVRARLRLRVPAESLNQALERIRDLSEEVKTEDVTGQDVTDEYVDLQSRMRHLEATEERLLAFMDDAEDTEAALSVYDRLQNTQAQIEQVRGRIQYLEQSAAMATITLTITPSRLAQPIQVGGWRPQGTLRDAFESLIRVLQFFADALIVIVVLVAPVLALIALPLVGLFFLIRGAVRRRRRSKTESQSEEAAQ